MRARASTWACAHRLHLVGFCLPIETVYLRMRCTLLELHFISFHDDRYTTSLNLTILVGGGIFPNQFFFFFSFENNNLNEIFSRRSTSISTTI